jgi:hypothetical protein
VSTIENVAVETMAPMGRSTRQISASPRLDAVFGCTERHPGANESMVDAHQFGVVLLGELHERLALPVRARASTRPSPWCRSPRCGVS